jgi:hypothetical protein
MKRTIYAVAASLAFASASVYAQAQNQWPQPSFNDNAPVDYTAAPSTPSRTPITQRDFPQPSFNDDAPVPEEQSAIGSTAVAGPSQGRSADGGPTGPASVVGEPGNPSSLHGQWPQPSFRY